MTEEAVTPAKARQALYRAASVRVPSFRPKGTEAPRRASEKISALEDHMILCARWIGTLEENRLYMYDGVKALEDQWDQIEGWEMAKDSKDKGQKAEVNAKRKIRPELYDGIREGKWLIARLSEQIRRLERDQEWVVSRVYTMLSA